MGIVYLVTSGTYSDYGVVRAFSTRELAEQWIGACRNMFNIEERPLDDLEQAPVLGLHGKISMSGQADISELVIEHGDRGRLDRIGLNTYGAHYIWMTFDHTDRERAFKVLAEKRAQIIALHGAELHKYTGFDRDTLTPALKYEYMPK